jgi:UDPglucose--hexose-1-phosphate uridylyltransferase
VVELWSARTAALAARADVRYVFVFENRGREIGATIDHPHSQILALGVVPPAAQAELRAGGCHLCAEPDPGLVVASHQGWRATVPWAPSWPYEMLISPVTHCGSLPAVGGHGRASLAGILVDCLARVERLLGAGAPYMLWVHQRPAGGAGWPAAHLHLHLVPVLRDRGVMRHLASAELGAGVFFDPVDPREAARALSDPDGGR